MNLYVKLHFQNSFFPTWYQRGINVVSTWYQRGINVVTTLYRDPLQYIKPYKTVLFLK